MKSKSYRYIVSAALFVMLSALPIAANSAESNLKEFSYIMPATKQKVDFKYQIFNKAVEAGDLDTTNVMGVSKSIYSLLAETKIKEAAALTSHPEYFTLIQEDRLKKIKKAQFKASSQDFIKNNNKFKYEIILNDSHLLVLHMEGYSGEGKQFYLNKDNKLVLDITADELSPNKNILHYIHQDILMENIAFDKKTGLLKVIRPAEPPTKEAKKSKTS